MFLGFKEGKTYVKMKKLGKKKLLAFQLGGPSLFVDYLDGKGSMDQNEGSRICVVKDKEKQLQD